MYGRFLGHYNLKDIITYILPNRDPVSEIKEYLLKKKAYFFSLGREALYVALLHRRSFSKKRYVAIPGWGCPIVLATISRAGFKPLVLDISTESLHINVNELVELANYYDIDSVMLVAENGIPYNSNEINIIKKNDISVIADYAIGWQNLNVAEEHTSDFEMFSGGFSKPISGLGLGILTTDYDIQVPAKLPGRQASFSLILMLIHIMLQKRWFYSLVKTYVPQDLQKEYDGKIHDYTKRSASVVVNSLIRRNKTREDWQKLQNRIRNVLQEKKSQAPLIHRNDCLQTKIIFEHKLLKSCDKPSIEFHKQYPYNLLDDARCVKINSDYENIRRLRKDFISIAINDTVINNQNNFLESFNNSIK